MGRDHIIVNTDRNVTVYLEHSDKDTEENLAFSICLSFEIFFDVDLCQVEKLHKLAR